MCMAVNKNLTNKGWHLRFETCGSLGVQKWIESREDYHNEKEIAFQIRKEKKIEISFEFVLVFIKLI